MKKLGVAIVVVATAAYVGVGQSQGKTDPTLDKLAKEFMTAFNAKDAAKVASSMRRMRSSCRQITHSSRAAPISRHISSRSFSRV